jgi:GDSL-like Lipase/Acylhydrolase family
MCQAICGEENHVGYLDLLAQFPFPPNNRRMNRVALLSLVAFLTWPGAERVQAAGPKIVRENIEWCDVWMPDMNQHDLPRVLLIGDSITRAYYPAVEKDLKGRACVARVTTSKSLGDPAFLAEVSTFLSEAKFDVIHFNNGMHGWGYSEEDYRRAFPQLLETLHRLAPNAKLIWATTTPVQPAGIRKPGPNNDRIEARNAIAAAAVKGEDIPVDNLFSLVQSHPEYYKPGGIHFNDQGIAVEARQVADEISRLLPAPPNETPAH